MSGNPRAARAVEAAQAVALANSVDFEDAVVLDGGSNVLVRLNPPPTIARVMTSTAVLHDDVETWLAREVAVGSFLAARGLGVPPSDALPPGPYQHEGLWMTFWTFVEHDASPALPSAAELGRSMHELHAALADFSGELGPLSEIRDWLDELLAELRPSPTLSAAERDSLRSRLHEMTPTVFESALPAQRSMVTRRCETSSVPGPVHWDVAGIISDVRAYGASEAYVADLLAAYGRVDLEELDEFVEAHRLYATVWYEFAASPSAT